MALARAFRSACLGRVVAPVRASLPILSVPVRWASKKAGGSTKNGRDSVGKRLGVKKFGGQHVKPGNIIIRQRGTHSHIEKDGTVGIGRDHTIFAKIEGTVQYRWDPIKKRKFISVVPMGLEARPTAADQPSWAGAPLTGTESPRPTRRQRREAERMQRAQAIYDALDPSVKELMETMPRRVI